MVFRPLFFILSLAALRPPRPRQYNAAIPDYFTDFPMVMFMISGVLLSEAGHAVTLDECARVAETRYVVDVGVGVGVVEFVWLSHLAARMLELRKNRTIKPTPMLVPV